jgi:hypothetical protein
MRGLALLWLIALAPAAALAQGDYDNAIDARIRASANAAESLQGPLDGTWTLVSASGQAIYVFQLVDKPGGRDPLEGCWRDLRRPPMPGDIGMIDSLFRAADVLTINFSAKPGDPPVTIRLNLGADGAWSGSLHEGGGDMPVRLRRG